MYQPRYNKRPTDYKADAQYVHNFFGCGMGKHAYRALLGNDKVGEMRTYGGKKYEQYLQSG